MTNNWNDPASEVFNSRILEPLNSLHGPKPDFPADINNLFSAPG